MPFPPYQANCPGRQKNTDWHYISVDNGVTRFFRLIVLRTPPFQQPDNCISHALVYGSGSGIFPESIIIGHSFYRKDFRGILQQIYGMDKAVPPLCQKNRGKFHNESVIGVFKCFILFIRVFPLEIRPAPEQADTAFILLSPFYRHFHINDLIDGI